MGSVSVPFEQGVITISGATRSGKTCFVYRLLQNLKGVYKYPPPSKILFCYAIYQPLYGEIKQHVANVHFYKGVPSEDDINEWCLQSGPAVHRLIILDDLSHLLINDPNIELLLTQGSHHRNISVIIITQNVFSHGKHSRSQSLNTQYFIIFRNLRDGNQVRCLSRQLFASSPNKLTHAYEDVMKNGKYGYLVVDMHPSSNDNYRLRSNVLPGEDCIIYTDRN
jgi:hypothetical protein